MIEPGLGAVVMFIALLVFVYLMFREVFRDR